MGRIIRGQIIAGSGPDREGDGIQPEVIQMLFEQIEEHGVIAVQHDLSQKPSCRAFNFKLVEKPDGHLVITADIEVLDENVFAEMGGFSISYLGNSYQIGVADHPAVQILINPKCFDLPSAINQLSRLVPEGYSIEIREKFEKAAIIETAVLILLLSPLVEIVKGLFSAAGADLYKWMKNLIRKDVPQAPVVVQLKVRTPVVAILSVSMELTPDEFSQIQIPDFQNVLPAGVQPSEVDRLVGSIVPGPKVNFQFVTLKNGRTIQLDAGLIKEDEL